MTTIKFASGVVEFASSSEDVQAVLLYAYRRHLGCVAYHDGDIIGAVYPQDVDGTIAWRWWMAGVSEEVTR